ncbi:PREDICTED: strictosidine synthase 3-like isoform X1 [Populus euphratica]|uniref:Strictosidine synthase 3-like isoform X1 n=1 Tax=Populus euphratica TaxID=75702 RepID=A0AAJ6UCM9_POPEU|nr:PREDICTED: strictosidine synthase 3-like isoform X1 [Populus euphratica]
MYINSSLFNNDKSSSFPITMASKLLFTAITLLLSTLAIVIFSSETSNIEVPLSSARARQLKEVPIVGAFGPESFAFDSLGQGPYTSLSDGRIIKWQGNRKGWTDFAVASPNRDGCGGPQDHQQTEHICGRPLGLCFDETHGDLYIADAYMGLLRVGAQGGLATKIVTHAQGIPLSFTNGLDIDQSNGAIYFTDSSSQYQRRHYLSVVLSGDKSGRLMKYDPVNKQVSVLLSNLTFPNGVALSKDGTFILLAETTRCRILRYWIKTSKAGTVEVFAQLQGFPDNIKRSPRGGYWVGLNSRREKLSELLFSYPWIGNVLLKLPLDISMLESTLSKYRGSGLAVRLSENGDILEVFEDEDGNRLQSVSEVMEKDEILWIGSIALPFAGRYRI